ncbi:unnamed protein product [Ectocarpus sp. CCAP 1310/34]|nr:unnamed protein product [Ectocarpus sp. CCAP 1310/34]
MHAQAPATHHAKTRQSSTPNLLKKPAPRPPSTHKPIRTSITNPAAMHAYAAENVCAPAGKHGKATGDSHTPDAKLPEAGAGVHLLHRAEAAPDPQGLAVLKTRPMARGSATAAAVKWLSRRRWMHAWDLTVVLIRHESVVSTARPWTEGSPGYWRRMAATTGSVPVTNQRRTPRRQSKAAGA